MVAREGQVISAGGGYGDTEVADHGVSGGQPGGFIIQSDITVLASDPEPGPAGETSSPSKRGGTPGPR